MAQEVGIRELLEAGVHFGHQTRRWNPKMRRFIHGERGDIYIIDLLRTEALLGQAQQFADGLARRGGTVLFVGTKKQARDGIKEIAESAGQPYVNHRWLGGLLTNFQTISLRIKRLHDLERYESEGQLGLLPTRERMAAQADLEKLRANLGGVKNMQRVPDALFVIDLKTEAIAVREAQRLRIPIIGLVDTNCDPDGIDYVIPGNDDGIRACNVITRAIGDVIAAGNRRFREEEERARQEAAEQARREAEEKARREAEEQARKEAEEAAAAEALTQGEAGDARRRRGDRRRGRPGPRAPAGRGPPVGRGRRRRAGRRGARRPPAARPRTAGRGRERGAAGQEGATPRSRRPSARRRGRARPLWRSEAKAEAPPPRLPPRPRPRRRREASRRRAEVAEAEAAPAEAGEARQPRPRRRGSAATRPRRPPTRRRAQAPRRGGDRRRGAPTARRAAGRRRRRGRGAAAPSRTRRPTTTDEDQEKDEK